MPHARTIRVAAGQMLVSNLAHADEALATIQRLAAAAAREWARLLVLPECAYPAYWLHSAEHYLAAARRDTPTFMRWLGELARAHRLFVVCGLVEESQDRLYNSAAVFAPDGSLIGIARKTFLWDCDNRWFTPGDEISVFDTALGRLGVLICADARAPETVATLAAKGANLLAMPTAWVNVSKQPGVLYNIQPDFLIEARAREFHLPFVCADKAGPEPPLHYVGQSLIVDAGGRVMHRAPVEGEHLLIGELTPTQPRPAVLSAGHRAALLTSVSDEPGPSAPDRAGPAGQPQSLTRLAIAAGKFTTGRARAATLDGDSARSFAAIRCLALDGVQVVCIRNATDDLATLRTRAAENRVFVLGTSHAQSVIIAPDGAIVARADTATVCADVDLRAADEKQFTPETNLWAQRRVRCFQLG